MKKSKTPKETLEKAKEVIMEDELIGNLCDRYFELFERYSSLVIRSGGDVGSVSAAEISKGLYELDQSIQDRKSQILKIYGIDPSEYEY
jgi:hypothetical protein